MTFFIIVIIPFYSHSCCWLAFCGVPVFPTTSVIEIRILQKKEKGEKRRSFIIRRCSFKVTRGTDFRGKINENNPEQPSCGIEKFSCNKICAAFFPAKGNGQYRQFRTLFLFFSDSLTRSLERRRKIKISHPSNVHNHYQTK